MKKILLLLCLAPAFAFASAEGVKLDNAPINVRDEASIQRGARTFVNYCLNCHSASYMRYNRLTSLGLTEQEIKQNLLFTTDKIGETMTIAMRKEDAVKWFDAAPPDLSVIARSRGADWLYTYLRSFYRDDARPNGWNNTVFENVAMPHALYQLQGIQVLKKETVPANAHGGTTHTKGKLVLETPGTLTPAQYNDVVADLVNFLVYMGEPAKIARVQTGLLTMLFLGILLVLAFVLKHEYWKDIRK